MTELSTNQSPFVESDELTLKDIILQTKGLFWEMVKYRKLISIVFLIALFYFAYNSYTTPTIYPGKLTFMLNDDGDEVKNGVSMILGSLGLGGFKGKRNVLHFVKLIRLAQTRTVIDKSLLTLVEIKGKHDLLGNFIINEYGFEELVYDYGKIEWIERLKGLSSFSFRKGVNLEDLNDDERIVLKILYENIIGNPERSIKPILRTRLIEDSETMVLSAAMQSQELTILLLKTVYKNLGDFFINITINQQQRTFDILNFKADSVLNALNRVEREIAFFNDANKKLVTVKGTVRESELNRQVYILRIIYAESIRNREIAEFSLKRRKPYVQLIDFPTKPLTPVNKSILWSLIYSSAISIFAGLFFLFVRNVIRDAMASK